MNRFPTVLLALLLAGVALAGCTTGDEDGAMPTPTTTTVEPTPVPTPTPTPATPTPPVIDETPVLGNGSYALTAVGIPAQVEQGKAFNYTLYVNGSLEASSDHVGAHFRNTTEGAVEVAAMTGACPHAKGNATLPGVFNLTCTFDAPGTYQVYGHARVADANGTYHFWALPVEVKVRNYTLTLANFPTSPQVSGQNFTFTLAITGSDNVTSDHIGAHYWNATTASPAVANAAGACTHTEGGAVGTYSVTCQLANTGATPARFFVRGHLRITEGGVQTSFWSAEHEVTVLGTLF